MADPAHPTTPARPERQLAFLGQLAGGLAHEIRNPLSTVGLNLELMLEDWADPQTPKEQRTLKKLRLLKSEVQRLEQILDEFLQYARGPELHLDKHDLVAVVTEVLDFIEPELQAARITLWQPHVGEPLPLVTLDRNKFTQVLLNLLINARQAMPKGGEITVRVEREAGGTLGACQGDALVVDISDTGEGIPPDLKQRIFDVYVSTKPGGTGLGLPTARRVVDAHGGTLELVSSTPGLGSLFRIRLPL